MFADMARSIAQTATPDAHIEIIIHPTTAPEKKLSPAQRWEKAVGE